MWRDIGGPKTDRGQAGAARHRCTAILLVVLVIVVAVLTGCSDSTSDKSTVSTDTGERPPRLPLVDARSATMLEPYEPKFELGDPLPELGGAGTVHRLVPPTVDDALAEMAATLGVDGDVVDQDGLRVVQSATGRVEAYENLGRVSLIYFGPPGSTRMPSPDTPPVVVPDDAESEQLARDFLAKVGIDVEGWEASVGADGATIADPPQVFSRRGDFFPELDGHPLHYLAWNVSVGEGGVSGAVGAVADVETIADYPLQSVQDAYDDLVAGTALSPADAGFGGISLDEVTVVGVEQSIGLFAAVEDGERVGYLVPTYVFDAEVPGEEGTVGFVVSAVDPTFVDLQPAPPED